MPKKAQFIILIGVFLSLCFAFDVWALNDGAGNEYFSSNIGIKTRSPTATLDVNGSITTNGFKMDTTAPVTVGHVLTATDANGSAAWQAPSNSGSAFGTWSDGIQEDISYKALSDGFLLVRVVVKDISGTSSAVLYVYTDSNKTPNTLRTKFVEIEPNTGDVNIEAGGFSGLVPVKVGEYVKINHTATYMDFNGDYSWLPIGSTASLELRASNNLSCSSGGGNYDIESTSSNTTTKTMDWSACEEIEFQDNATGAVVRTINFTAPARSGALLLRLIKTASTSVAYTWPASVTWTNGTPTGLNIAGTYTFSCTYTSSPVGYQCTHSP